MKQVLFIQMRDDRLALNRLTALFHRRAIEFDSIAIDRVSLPDVLQAIVVVDDGRVDAARLATHLRNLQHVFFVQCLAQSETIARQLALIKVGRDAGLRAEIVAVACNYGAWIEDNTAGVFILQCLGAPDQIRKLMSDLNRLAIAADVACSGTIALPQG